MAVFQPSGRHVLQSMKPCDLSTCTRSEIKEYFENSYDLYETLFKALEDESAFYKCSDRLRLPLIFYFGHTAAVYVNKLVLGGLLKERINFYFETLFETGVDEMSWDDTENYRMGGSFVWPKVAEVAEYRKKARQVILDVIENTPLELPVTQESIWWAVFMGFEHERIHFETSSVLIRQMPVELVRRPKGWKYGPLKTGDPVLSNPLIEITEQSVSMGKPENFPSYGWDNEYGQWNVTVPAFIASKYLITNREYLEFVNDRGYENSKYWTKKGWQWKQFRKLHHPSFWVCGNNCKTGSGSDLATYSHCNLKLTDVNHNELPENYIINGNDDVSNGVMNGDHQHGWSNGVVNGEHQHGLSNGVMNGDHQHGLSNGVVNGEHQHGLSNGVMNGDHQHGLSNGVMNGDHQHGLSNGVVNGDHQHGLSNGDHQQGLSNGVVNGDHQHGWSNGVMNGDHQHGLSNGVMNGDHQHGLSNGVVNGDHQHGWSNGVMNGDHYLSGEANGSINGSPDRNALLNGIAVNGYSKAINSPYKFRAMFEVMDMPMDWPAEVNYHEAKAFCAWKGSDYRLPTEAEHHVMRGPQKPLSDGTACDIIFQDKIEANINMAYGSSTPVNMYPPTETGFCDVFGNVWEWVEDHFNGFGEFKAHLLYDDFSSPCFDGRHNMIMGGSWVSTGDEASRFARYAFRRHFFQHLGFRVAQTVADSPPVRLVETPVFVLGVGVEDNAVTVPGIDVSKAYVNTTNLQYHDDSEEFMCSEVVSNYGDLLGVESDADCCKQLAQLCKEAIHKHNKCPVKRALDIMCSVGRFSYELSKCLEEVIAIDHSGRLLDAALKIRQGKSLEIKGAKDFPSINIPLDEIQGNVDRVRFQQFTWLPNEIGVFDMIVMSSLKRLANPEAWLVRLWEILNPHGLLVIKTNALWDLESLIAVLGTKFTLLETRVIPCEREGLRKSDICHSSVTVWRLKH